MATFLRMPGVSADSDEAALENWLVAAGASVKKGEAVAAVETEKAVVDIVAELDGVVHTLLADVGDMVPVGDPIAIVLAVGEDPSAAAELAAQLSGTPASAEVVPSAPAATAASASVAEDEAAPVNPDPVSVEAAQDDASTGSTADASCATGSTGRSCDPGPKGGRIFASPLARRLAKEYGLSIEDLDGTGPNGRIVRDDVERARASAATPAAAAPAPQRAAAQPAPTPAADIDLPEGGEATPHSKLRRLIANRLQTSKRDAPHFYLEATLRVDELLALRTQLNEASEIRISVNDLFVKAAALALRDVPELNVIWTPDAVVSFATQDVAVAVASERGLVTPVIANAGALSIGALAAKVKDAVARANEGRLQQSELQGGAISVTNLGMFGVDAFSAIINPPHSAILAVGAARKVPVVLDDDTLGVGTVVTVTLSVDHRPVDGIIAARWLARLRELIEKPLGLLI
ncbi:2-oxo acid dehydrogenase subunit E2 [Pseudoclavibacter sp. RFBJ3]|uniref:dihydrolipoamide acetyltransferase family protein n=1 Tax=unclassified Pseudoclavibacter TaxID=2615177 RepID=UPI000CE759E3|nr:MULTISPECIES: dihydrolipoamide acetyltransferase family protein [unclassified Pseudoclavibacter]PPF82542.1 2-oxo acid dehydrogenase subunit E2 [Pseudoclavibacter sp. RFBJ5]PPF91436.1 2-oxo acid dehydrogenase subunit E2 [Pseudoclavibacter sp. RFBJ3]PPF96360.1 2-oxo acid dehydrogenase subunit E2 [Pseudoclavibacter sp. RFBH5]PPG22106.1 2-oxo acid dehydrogenase subunit E2 [Pseudoclavibacter sp. RFBI4]